VTRLGPSALALGREEGVPAALHLLLRRIQVHTRALGQLGALHLVPLEVRESVVRVEGAFEAPQVRLPRLLGLEHAARDGAQLGDGLLVRGLVVGEVEGIVWVEGRANAALELAEGLDALVEARVGVLQATVEALDEVEGLLDLALLVVGLELVPHGDEELGARVLRHSLDQLPVELLLFLLASNELRAAFTHSVPAQNGNIQETREVPARREC
jgi:hypothetical protein